MYVQIIVNAKNYKMKSGFPFNDGYLRETDLAQDFVINSNALEKNKIEKIVSYYQESNTIDLMTAESIKKYSESLWDLLNRNFGKLFEKESEILPSSYPSCLINRNYFDIDETLKFTESQIETKFTEDYRYCKIGMDAICWGGIFDKEYQDLGILKLTVFDFLHGHGFNNVLESIRRHHGFYGGDEEKEYLRVLDEIKKIILLD